MKEKLTASQKMRLAASLPDASEHAIQSAFFDSLKEIPDKRVDWIYSVPNGGDRNLAVAAMMKKEGLKSGVWDVCLPFPSGPHPFAYIEFKRPIHCDAIHGGLSDKQVEFGRHIIAQNAAWRICYSWQDAQQFVLNYMGLK